MLKRINCFKKKPLAFTASITLIDQFLVTGCNFFTTLVVARNLSIDDFGSFSLLWTIVLLANTFQYSIVVSPMFTLGPAEPAKNKNSFYLSYFLMGLILISLLVPFIIFALKIFPVFNSINLKNINILVFCIVIITYQVHEYARAYFFSESKPIYSLIADLILIVSRFSILAIFKHLNYLGLGSIYLAIGLSFAIGFIGSFSNLNIKLNFDLQKFKYHILRNINFAKWIVLTNILQWLSGNFFIFITASYLSISSVGAISVIKSVIGPTLILFTAFDNVVTPMASQKLNQGNKLIMLGFMKRCTIAGVIPTLLVISFLAIFSNYIIGTMFGDEYIEYSYLMIWFAFAHLILFLMRPITIILNTLLMTKTMASATMVATTFSIISSLVLIKNFGLLGTMIVMTSTQLVKLVYLIGSNKKLIFS